MYLTALLKFFLHFFFFNFPKRLASMFKTLFQGYRVISRPGSVLAGILTMIIAKFSFNSHYGPDILHILHM